MTETREDLRPRIPPNQVVTQKFPVMTAGTPATAGIEEWTLALDGDVENPVTLEWAAFNALPQQDFTADIHCVTRWSKLDTRWRGVSLQVLADLVRPKTGSDYVQARATWPHAVKTPIRPMCRWRECIGWPRWCSAGCWGRITGPCSPSTWTPISMNSCSALTGEPRTRGGCCFIACCSKRWSRRR